MITRPEARLATSSSVGWSGFWARAGKATKTVRAARIRTNRFAGDICLWVHHKAIKGFGDFRFERKRKKIAACLDGISLVRACPLRVLVCFARRMPAGTPTLLGLD